MLECIYRESTYGYLKVSSTSFSHTQDSGNLQVKKFSILSKDSIRPWITPLQPPKKRSTFLEKVILGVDEKRTH